MKPRMILASSSPRREEILRTLGFKFTVLKPDNDEKRFDMKNPAEYVLACAEEKTKNAAREISKEERGADTLVMAADTVVALNNKILGKPQTKEEAFLMLKQLSGKTHDVFTGVSLYLYANESKTVKKKVFYDKTSVTFRKLLPAEIKKYVRSGEPMDKAGAYAIQEKGRQFVKHIHGCYFNVVGLPVYKLGFALRELGRAV